MGVVYGQVWFGGEWYCLVCRLGGPFGLRDRWLGVVVVFGRQWLVVYY